MTRTLTLLAVDDERPALEDLVRLLRGSPSVAKVQGADDADEALALLAAEPVDGLFLDVRMPGLDGLQLANVVARFARPPAVVFVSAHQTAASQAFDARALDYLLKPVSRPRLERALARMVEALGPGALPAATAAAGARDVVAVDLPRGGTRLLPRASVLYLQAYGDYVRVVSTSGRFLLRERLSDIEQRWEPAGFARVHRGFAVNLRHVVELRPLLNGTAVLVLADGSEVPVARRQVAELRRTLRV